MGQRWSVNPPVGDNSYTRLYMQLVLTYVIGFAVSVALVPLCRLIAIRLGYVARPKADRWHQRHTALLGGVAIATVTLGGGGFSGQAAQLWVVLASGAAVFLLGLIDDLLSLKPSTKLVAEIVLASLLVYFGYRLHWSDSLTLDTMLTLFWVVGVTNAFNLLDNMDGLCAGIGLIVSGALMVAFIDNDPARAQYLALLMGALSGFLIYNFNPASIFMGDSGSLFIGLTLSTLALEPAAGSRAGPGVLSIIGAPLLLLLIPIFDTTLVTVLRLLSGRKPSQGGRDHSSHRLVAIGLPERKAVLVLWTLAALGGLIGLELRLSETGLGAAAAVAFVIAMVIFAVYLSHVRVYEPTDVALRTGKITPFVSEWMYKRRAAEVMLDVCLVALSYYVSYRVRFEGPEYGTYFPQFMASLPIVLGVQMVTLFAFGAYRGVWRYFGLMDGVTFAKGVGVGTVASVTAIVFAHRFENYSRGVFIIYAALLLLALIGSRASFRLMSEFIRRRQAGDRLVVYGAGDGGSVVVRELMNDEHHYRVLGFIDDDPGKQRLRVQGFAVLGGYDTLEVLARERAVDAIVVSAREMPASRLQQLEELCAANDITLSRLHVRFEQLVAS
jgi:UDP-GlcNAc:undecaprenyl-phosphate/decaprenyl-phosphate GlcNAc-1-phosphate transferase